MVLVAGFALALLVGVAGAAPQPVGSDFRISNTPGDGVADRRAFQATITYNPTANEYLVVWVADGLETDDEFEIFGQRLDATGAEIGGDFRISNVGLEKVANREAFEPAVTYNPTANEYLVVWVADGLETDNEFEIFGQLLDANGAEMGADFPISNVAGVGEPAREAREPAVTYNAATNEFLVVWRADGLVNDDEFEIFGQRLNADGTEPEGDFRISDAPDIEANRAAFEPAVTYNPATNQYLVVWEGDDPETAGAGEIIGKLLGAGGVDMSGDFPISDITDVAANRDAFHPAVTYNPTANEYLVVWEGDGLETDGEFEIFGQRLGGTGSEVREDFRISNTGADGDKEREATRPAVTYNPTANAYLVAWEGDGLATKEEFEIFAQLLSADGAEIGADLRISNAGTDGDPERDAFGAALAANPTANEYLVVWGGDGLATNDELEIFGRRLAEPILPSSPPAGKCAGVMATKTGTAGADVIRGTAKRDVIAALGGRDTVRSLGGNDLVCGGSGKDRIFASKGKDKLRGDAGADRLNGGSGNDDLRGGKGRDVLKGGKGRDVLKGGPGKDVLAGGPGEDKER